MVLITLGAAVPPDVITGGILGAAFAISTGKGADVALALAFPIATLYLVVDNVLTLGILPFFLRKADNYIEKGDFKRNGANAYTRWICGEKFAKRNYMCSSILSWNTSYEPSS